MDVVGIVLLVIIAVLVVYIYFTATHLSAYYWINVWNEQLTEVRDVQNRLRKDVDQNLPPSMQYAATANHAGARRLEALLTTNHNAIRQEVLDLIAKGYYGFPMAEVDFLQGASFKNQRGWRPIWVKLLNRWAGASRHLPTLRRVVEQMGDDVVLLHISVFWPPVSLPRHRGISKGMYRYHYGLIIPEGDTGLEVDGVSYKWEEGKGVIWDDTLPHRAWNLTSQPRLVIFADLPRELGWGMNWLNRRVHSLVQRTSHVQEIQEKLAKEGIRID